MCQISDSTVQQQASLLGTWNHHLAGKSLSGGPQNPDEAETLAAIVDSCHDAIIAKNRDGIITSWNPSAQKIFGFTPEEAIGQSIYIIIPPELIEEERQILTRLRRGERITNLDTVRLRKDGSRVEVSVTISPIHDWEGNVIGASKIARDITERREKHRLQQESRLKTILLEVQDAERRRIARELHDSVGQLIAAVTMEVFVIEQEKDKLSGQGLIALNEISELARQLAQEVRTISHLLHPPLLEELGLAVAAQTYVEGFSKRSNISVQLSLQEDLDALPREHQVCLFRVMQECLTNIHRHSQSSTADVRLYREDHSVTLHVRDYGKGFRKSVLKNASIQVEAGVGLRGMRERLKQLGGSLEIESDHQGTRVTARLPNSNQP